jgi:hypothetical protein
VGTAATMDVRELGCDASPYGDALEEPLRERLTSRKLRIMIVIITIRGVPSGCCFY